jgi:hypothetical protein
VGYIFPWLSIVLFPLLIYFMFFTRRTVLRVFGWGWALLIFVYVCLSASNNSGAANGVEATKIVNDLRGLLGAVMFFQKDYDRLPLPGEEASLDLYMDRPLVTVERPRYAKVMLSGELSDDIGASRQFVGVELRPESNGGKNIQRKLSLNARSSGLLEKSTSDDKKMLPYRSGLNVYMEIRQGK